MAPCSRIHVMQTCRPRLCPALRRVGRWPGTLPRHATYLHQRTAGRIGSLTRLIRQATITAIHDGTERITKTTLEAVRLDHHAETHQLKTRTPTRRTTR